MRTHHVDHTAPRRKTAFRAERAGLDIPTVITSPPVDVAHQLSVGGRLIHKRTHRCVAFCNAVASLAGIGHPAEAR